jgi:hypothetical protein
VSEPGCCRQHNDSATGWKNFGSNPRRRRDLSLFHNSQTGFRAQPALLWHLLRPAFLFTLVTVDRKQIKKIRYSAATLSTKIHIFRTYISATLWGAGFESPFFYTLPERPWGPPSLPYKENWGCVLQVKRRVRGVEHPTLLASRLHHEVRKTGCIWNIAVMPALHTVFFLSSFTYNLCVTIPVINAFVSAYATRIQDLFVHCSLSCRPTQIIWK